MPVFVTCNHCAALVGVPADAPGTPVRCSQCRTVFNADPNSMVEVDFDPNAPDLEPPAARTTVDETWVAPRAVPAGPGAPSEGSRHIPTAVLAVPGDVSRPPSAPPPTAILLPTTPPSAAPGRSPRLPLLLGATLAVFGVLALTAAGLLVWWSLHSRPADLISNPQVVQPEGRKEKDTPASTWTVLFRSDDPTAWDTDSSGARFAVPLSRAPATTRYLRLRRMDTGEALIVPLARNQLNTAPQPVPTRGAWWNGTAKYAWGGRHLGIAEAPRLPFPNFDNLIAVMNDGWDVFLGSGFGHKCFRNEKAGQCYCWRGKEIAKTAFEVAVTADLLSPVDQRCLLAGP
jgi:hypothetical protein